MGRAVQETVASSSLEVSQQRLDGHLLGMLIAVSRTVECIDCAGYCIPHRATKVAAHFYILVLMYCSFSQSQNHALF